MQYSIKKFLLRTGAPFRRVLARNETKDLPDAIFVWIPKSAGTSVYASLAGLGMAKFKSLEEVRCLFSGSGMVTFAHQSVSCLVEAGAVNRSFVHNAYKFSFVRDPLHRCASLFRYFRKLGRVPPDMSYPQFIDKLEREWELHQALPHVPESAMSDKLLYSGEEFSQSSTRLQQVGLYNVLDWSQCRPQIDWLKDLGSRDEIHIGRIENADEDYAKIIIALSERSSRIPSSGIILPRLNTTHVEKGSGIRADPGIKRIVENIYAVDFEAFSY